VEGRARRLHREHSRREAVRPCTRTLLSSLRPITPPLPSASPCRCHVGTGTGLTPLAFAGHRDCARYHIGAGTALTTATSAPGLRSLPHLHRDCARYHICSGTALATKLHWDCPRYRICTGTGLTTAISAPGLGSPPPHLHRDWASHACHRSFRRYDAAVKSGVDPRSIPVVDVPSQARCSHAAATRQPRDSHATTAPRQPRGSHATTATLLQPRYYSHATTATRQPRDNHAIVTRQRITRRGPL
jgi:hypothetical protein